MSQNRSEHPEGHELVGQRYLIVRSLRDEPWGGVWLAQDNLLRTEVGLKLLARDAPEWAAARDMFERQAVLGRKLRHPQILGVFHVDKAEKFLYLVEEPFLGESLMTQLARPVRFSMGQALDLLELLGQTLAYAHQQGEVHQSLSPDNILLHGEDLRLANFAFAPAYEDQPLHLELKAYVPPEVIQGDNVTPAGNVFSLGVLGFRLVAGSLPYALTFDEPFPYRLEYPPVDLEEIPLSLQNVLLRCLSEDPEERLPHAGAFVSQLRQARELIHGGGKKRLPSRRSEKSGAGWQPLAQAGPWLKKVWESGLPYIQKAKELAAPQVNALKQLPRRLWWGLGLAVLVVALIIAGTKMRRQPAPLPPPAKVALPAGLPPMGGGPPLVETGEFGPSPQPAAAGQPSAPGHPAEVSREAQNERYLVVVATYGNLKQAQTLQQRLRAKNLKAVVIARKTGNKKLYVVQVGPLTGAKAAEDAAGRIKTQEKITAKVVKLPSKTANNQPSRRPTR
ncbi:MAG: protein kinase [Syntrophobacterales bacterium]|jgi:serine/threonine-protein kinase|nr:protein kinase [Syntrophobacterales bacterium]